LNLYNLGDYKNEKIIIKIKFTIEMKCVKVENDAKG